MLHSDDHGILFFNVALVTSIEFSIREVLQSMTIIISGVLITICTDTWQRGIELCRDIYLVNCRRNDILILCFITGWWCNCVLWATGCLLLPQTKFSLFGHFLFDKWLKKKVNAAGWCHHWLWAKIPSTSMVEGIKLVHLCVCVCMPGLW